MPIALPVPGDPVWLFHTPSIIERTLSRDPLLARTKTQVGISVLKENGFYRTVRFPSCEEIAAADAVYLGGYEHTVSDAEAASLRAAGYTDLTLIV
jgi:hypothetical protein